MTKHKKTYLFFPIEIGLAHICRSLAIAEELVRRGHTVYFGLPKRKWQLFSRTTVTLVPVTSYVIADDFGMNVRLFRDVTLIEKVVSEELALIDRYKPDAVVVDFRISALVAGIIRHVPTYAVFVGDGLPYGAILPNPGLPSWLYSLLQGKFPRMYDLATRWFLSPYLRYLRRYIPDMTFDSWMHRVAYIVPEAPFYMPATSQTITISYTGTLSWYAFDNPTPPWFDDLRRDGRTIYLSFGGTGFDAAMPIEICKALLTRGYRVVVTTGSISRPSDYPSHPDLYVATFLPGDVIPDKVDILICHGGYGTMMDAIQRGVPVIAIPFNPDQILHAARMQELGLAKTLMNLTAYDVYNALTFRWNHIEAKAKRLNPNIVVDAVEEMFEKIDYYRSSIDTFNARYPSRNGAADAVDVIERDAGTT